MLAKGDTITSTTQQMKPRCYSRGKNTISEYIARSSVPIPGYLHCPRNRMPCTYWWISWCAFFEPTLDFTANLAETHMNLTEVWWHHQVIRLEELNPLGCSIPPFYIDQLFSTTLVCCGSLGQGHKGPCGRGEPLAASMVNCQKVMVCLDNLRTFSVYLELRKVENCWQTGLAAQSGDYAKHKRRLFQTEEGLLLPKITWLSDNSISNTASAF